MVSDWESFRGFLFPVDTVVIFSDAAGVCHESGGFKGLGAVEEQNEDG